MGYVVSLVRLQLMAAAFLATGSFSAPVMSQTARFNDQILLDQGRALYAKNCSVCHGSEAQGTAQDWHEPDANGKYPPPPLNGTAHTWHHSISALGQVIRQGTEQIGGSMPAWKDKLTDDQIFSIIMYLTSLWPDEIYEAWMRQNQQ